MALAVTVWSQAPLPIAILLGAVTAALALARPRGGLVVAAAGAAAWMALGADDPGAAILVLFLVAPLVLVPLEPGPALALPGLAPLMGVVGAAGGYPALAGMPRHGLERALLGGVGYLWLVAAEAASGRELLLGAAEPAPPDWAGHAPTAIGEVIVPLFGPAVLLGTAIWALAAFTLPFFVRGRFGALDLLGATLWAAALVSAERLLAGPDADAGGLLLVVMLAAGAAVVVAHRARVARDRRPTSHRGPARTLSG
jgi:hypothetical protein